LPLAVTALLLATVGCRQDMHDQSKFEAYEQTTLFADGKSAQAPIEGTVARGELVLDDPFHTGYDESGALLSELPMPVTGELLRRGQERYGIFCTPCHSAAGDGNGMIVRRGFKQPQSFHSDRLRAIQIGYFFDVMTNGFGQMSSYVAQVPVEDRWAIAAYVRVLQFSQGARLAELPAADRQAVLTAASTEAAAGAGADTDHGHSDEHPEEGH
jgi:hypothetical protein